MYSNHTIWSMLSESSSSTYLQAQVKLQVLRNYAPAVMMAEDKQEQQLSA